jgi:hypothetical protein
MDLNKYVGQSFDETEFFYILQFEIEEHFEQFQNKFLHFYFERLADSKIKICELVISADDDEYHDLNKQNLDKKEWYEIYENGCQIDFMLVRKDRTGKRSVNFKDSNQINENFGGYCYADEYADEPPMTEDEIRLAFQELAGMMPDPAQLKSNSKKSV